MLKLIIIFRVCREYVIGRFHSWQENIKNKFYITEERRTYRKTHRGFIEGDLIKVTTGLLLGRESVIKKITDII